jgi:hypothetical protein
MAKAIVAVMTDYSHQSLKEIVYDLELEHQKMVAMLGIIEDNLSELAASNYWNNRPSAGFKSIVSEGLRQFKRAQRELHRITLEIQAEVTDHHCKQLQTISLLARRINVEIRKVWHRDFDEFAHQEHDDTDFRKVSSVYADIRNLAVNLLDLAYMADRLSHNVPSENIAAGRNRTRFSFLYALLVGMGLIAIMVAGAAQSPLLVMILAALVFAGATAGLFHFKNDLTSKNTSPGWRENLVRPFIGRIRRLQG